MQGITSSLTQPLNHKLNVFSLIFCFTWQRLSSVLCCCRRHGCLDLDLELELDAFMVSLCPSAPICCPLDCEKYV